eukprot:3156309-Pyramimonas_sp.AAC.1
MIFAAPALSHAMPRRLGRFAAPRAQLLLLRARGKLADARPLDTSGHAQRLARHDVVPVLRELDEFSPRPPEACSSSRVVGAVMHSSMNP